MSSVCFNCSVHIILVQCSISPANRFLLTSLKRELTDRCSSDLHTFCGLAQTLLILLHFLLLGGEYEHVVTKNTARSEARMLLRRI
jgi:hypothetical protein